MNKQIYTKPYHYLIYFHIINVVIFDIISRSKSMQQPNQLYEYLISFLAIYNYSLILLLPLKYLHLTKHVN